MRFSVRRNPQSTADGILPGYDGFAIASLYQKLHGNATSEHVLLRTLQLLFHTAHMGGDNGSIGFKNSTGTTDRRHHMPENPYFQ